MTENTSTPVLNERKGLNYNYMQLTLLVIMRTFIGWHFLYSGISHQFLHENWSAKEYLLESKGMFSNFFIALANNPDVLQIVDLLNIWGTLAIGIGLILGGTTRVAAFAGSVLLGLFFFAHPPLPEFQYSIYNEVDALIVNSNLIELSALILLTFFPTGRIGIDRFLFPTWKKNF